MREPRRLCPWCHTALEEIPGDELRCPACRCRARAWVVAVGRQLVAAGHRDGILLSHGLARGLTELRAARGVFAGTAPETGQQEARG